MAVSGIGLDKRVNWMGRPEGSYRREERSGIRWVTTKANKRQRDGLRGHVDSGNVGMWT